MSIKEVQPSPLLPKSIYEHLEEHAPGMDLKALSSIDSYLSIRAAKTADSGILLAGVLGTIAMYLTIDKLAHSGCKLEDLAEFNTSLGGSFIAISWTIRALNEVTYRAVTRPNETHRIKTDLEQFMKSEKIPAFK